MYLALCCVYPSHVVPWSSVPPNRFWGYSCYNCVVFSGRRWPDVLKVPRRSHKLSVAQAVVCAPINLLCDRGKFHFLRKPRTKASFSHLPLPFWRKLRTNASFSHLELVLFAWHLGALFPVDFHTKRLLWHVDAHFDCAGSQKVWAALLGCGIFLVNSI